jgi:hypothetical protein
MPRFNSGRITTNAILYNRGVPNSARNFGALVSINYEILKALTIYNRRNGRPVYSLF